MEKPARKGAHYRTGELEVILSLAPTDANIEHLASLLQRSEQAIRIVYKIAFDKLAPSGDKDKIQWRKIRAAMANVGIRPL